MSIAAVKPFDPMTVRPDFPILQTRLHKGPDAPRSREGVPLVYLDNAATRPRSGPGK
jgi:hypothetical protein